MRDTILELLEQKGDLPPLPDIVFRIQKMVQNIKTNVRDIALLIELEPVLAGRIIKLSNSAFYSRSVTPIKTLPVAITKIGLNVLVKLVYSLKLCTLFTDSKIIDSSLFWKHSLAVAMFTQMLSSRIRVSREEQDIAYLSGLMHDVGVMVFGYLIQKDYLEFLKTVHTAEETLEVQEKRKFGIDHAELGALFVSKWWQMDENISIAVKQHHFPFQGPTTERRCEQLVHIANGICNNQGITNGINCYHEIFKEGAWEELGLSLSEVDTILNDVQASLEQARELINMTK